MPNRFTNVAGKAAAATNKELREELAKLTTLSEQKLNDMLPRRTDKQKLAELMHIVHSSAQENNKITKLGQNLQRLGPVVFKVLKTLV